MNIAVTFQFHDYQPRIAVLNTDALRHGCLFEQHMAERLENHPLNQPLCIHLDSGSVFQRQYNEEYGVFNTDMRIEDGSPMLVTLPATVHKIVYMHMLFE